MKRWMLDFVKVRTERKQTRNGTTWIVSPRFHISYSMKNLMVRGGDFYAFYDENGPLWSTQEQDVIDYVDRLLNEEVSRLPIADDDTLIVKYMAYSDSGSIDQWHKLVQKQMRDCFHPLDDKIIFANSDVTREDYASKRLTYALVEGECPAYEELMGTLYEPEELEKLEWAIGAIIKGDSKRIQKFEVLYGDKGTGKGTFLDILGLLFKGYTASFDDKALASGGGFPLEPLKDNPPVGIQGDGDLSHIKDNTVINSLVSHEYMPVNTKYGKIFRQKFHTFLFIGTNSPVEITDPKSGILRRLIDVHPSGRKLPYKKYHQLKKQVEFELGAIAYRCLKVYEELGEDYYEDYVPLRMMAETNDFYNFMEFHYDDFVKEDMVTLTSAWKQYGEYCEFANAFKMSWRKFRNEIGNYWRNFEERGTVDGKRVRSLYSGFRTDKFEVPERKTRAKKGSVSWLRFDFETSLFDKEFSLCLAQGCKEDGSPARAWKNVTTRLSDIDTRTLHWVKPPGKLICIDFDIVGKDGEKNLEKNIQAALKWPKTYAELSKSGKAIHLYYYYEGDVCKLSGVFEPYIEVKTFPEDSGSSLRRMLTKCNDIPIATISSGLPLKGDTKVQSEDRLKDAKHLKNCILKALRKEIPPGYTTTCIHYIKKVLDEAYDSGMGYDVSDLYTAVFRFASNSTHQSDHCVDVVAQMHFKSKEVSEPIQDEYEDDDNLYFFDIEIYKPDPETNNPGLFLICWKKLCVDNVSVMVNPKPFEVEQLFYPEKGKKRKLIGFNCRNYDNAMCWAASMGYSNQKLYDLSQRIIIGHERPFLESVNWSYLDMYDCATEKMSLKKWEIKLGITHKEMGIPWDEPAPLDRWDEIIGYCKNDVLATEALYLARQGDVAARRIQVDLVHILHGDDINVCMNDTTNTLSKRIIFGKEKNPQKAFNWRDLSKPVSWKQYEEYREKFGDNYKFRVFDAEGLPLYRDYVPGEELPDGYSILPFFKGYVCERGEKNKYISTYLNQTIGEGGRVLSNPGYYEWVWDGDISSQHPHSMKEEVTLGPVHQKIMDEIVEARVAVKHRDYETAGKLLGGALKPYLNDKMADSLAQALKIVINSIYGLTKAGFKNEFRDPRNYDNIVAKRGALFMTLLKREVEKRGGNVAHIKTDSIKIPNCGKAMQDFVIKFGKEFGYDFETEGVFTKFALFNDAAYVAKTDSGEWITKADQFKAEKQPYLYKTLFSHEPYEFKDFCETKSVSEGALYLDMNEDLGEPVDELYEKAVKKLCKIGGKLDSEFPEIMAKLDYTADDDYWIKDQGSDELTSQYELCKRLKEEMPSHHNYVFVGRVGQFTPVVKGAGGGVLYRKNGDKYYAATGSTGYRWLESDHVKEYGMTDVIDMDFYRKKVDDAMDAINEIVDADWFINGGDPVFTEDPYIDIDFMNIPEGSPDEVPWEE